MPLQGLRDALRLPNPRVDSSRRRSLLAADHLASPPPNGGSTALIVVDAQRCWYSNAANGRARTAFPALPQRLKALLEGARQEGIPVVHLRASYESSPHVSTMRRLNPSLNINPIVPDDPEPWARELEGEDVIYKSTFDGFFATPLESRLEELGVTRVLICGLVTSACVLGTALGAFYRGLDVLLVEDCCADRSIERHEATVGMYSDYCFQSILARDFLGASHEDLPPAAGACGSASKQVPEVLTVSRALSCGASVA